MVADTEPGLVVTVFGAARCALFAAAAVSAGWLVTVTRRGMRRDAYLALFVFAGWAALFSIAGMIVPQIMFHPMLYVGLAYWFGLALALCFFLRGRVLAERRHRGEDIHG